ncbi:MAG: hypothetical protein IJL80_05985 [Treponema sp.]|nr:hypothetical protein [Treponema sp.]
MSNAGDMEGIIARLTGGNGGSSTASASTVILKASEIGLPSGGTATLVIQGNGVDYTATATADADGNVTFEIPAITSGTEITASLTIKNSSGTALYAGSSTQTVSGDSLRMDIRLIRQFWMLPASISLTASPDGFAYDSTRLAETTTLSISGLEDAPAGTALSYAWELDSSPLSDSGSSLTRSWSELIGPAAPSGDLTKTFTVTVSYTDETGDTQTVSASRSVVIGPPVTIPAFNITIDQPSSYNAANSSGTCYALVNLTDTFAFTATPPAGSFPAGTTYSWSVGGTSRTTTTPTLTFTPADLGVSASNNSSGSAKAISVSCTARNSRATADTPGTAASASAFLLALPDLKLTNNTSLETIINSIGYALYLYENGTESLSYKVESNTSGVPIPAGAKYTWSIGDWTVSDSSSDTASPTISEVCSAYAAATGVVRFNNLKCTVSVDGLGSKTASAGSLRILKKGTQLTQPSIYGLTAVSGVSIPASAVISVINIPSGGTAGSAIVDISFSSSQPVSVDYIVSVTKPDGSSFTATLSGNMGIPLSSLGIDVAGEYKVTFKARYKNYSVDPEAFPDSEVSRVYTLHVSYAAP